MKIEELKLLEETLKNSQSLLRFYPDPLLVERHAKALELVRKHLAELPVEIKKINVVPLTRYEQILQADKKR